MKLKIYKGTTSKLVRVFIQDASVTGTPAGLTGLTYNSAGLSAYYIREGEASPTAITLADATIGTFTSGGFKQVSATNMPGVYELGIPNAVLAAGASSALIMLKGATNMPPVLMEIELDAVNYQDDVRFGLAAIPNAAVGAAGSVARSSDGTVLVPQTGDAYGRIGAAGAGLTALGDTRLDNLDATVSSRLAAAGYTAPDNTNIGVAATQATTAATNTGTLLSRLGSWTGSGINTVLGAFKSLLSKVASAPSDIGGTFDPATDSVEALRDRGDSGAWGGSTLEPQDIADAMRLTPTGTVQAGSVDDQLSGISDFLQIDASVVTLVAADSAGRRAGGALMVVSTDAAGANIVATGSADAHGKFLTPLVNGSYYLWISHPRIKFTNPAAFTVPEA